MWKRKALTPFNHLSIVPFSIIDPCRLYKSLLRFRWSWNPGHDVILRKDSDLQNKDFWMRHPSGRRFDHGHSVWRSSLWQVSGEFCGTGCGITYSHLAGSQEVDAFVGQLCGDLDTNCDGFFGLGSGHGRFFGQVSGSEGYFSIQQFRMLGKLMVNTNIYN